MKMIEDNRPIKAQQMRHKKTGEIVTSVPLTQINNYELVK